MRVTFSLLLVSVLTACASESAVVERPVDTDLLRSPSINRGLNVSIAVFDPGNTDAGDAFEPIRIAETHYLSTVLKLTLIESGHWGAVRVTPGRDPTAEIQIFGTIVQSDGVRLRLHIRAVDSTGKVWTDRLYSDLATDHAYNFEASSLAEPFSDLFNRVSNDMSMVLAELTEKEASNIMNTAMLKYAIALSPETFSRYLKYNDEGSLIVTGLPARNSKMYQRVKRIRNSEYKFIDALDEQAMNLREKMQEPYAYWRRYAFELIRYNEKIENSNGVTVSANTFKQMRDVYELYQESRLNEDELRKLAHAFDNEVTETVLELEDTVIRLEGTIENQYEQWREILKQIYRQETGVDRSAVLPNVIDGAAVEDSSGQSP